MRSKPIQCDMERIVIIIPSRKFVECGMPVGARLRVLTFFYGISDSGDAWHYKLKSSIKELLKIIETTADQAQYYCNHQGPERGMISPFVDDILQ